MSELSAKLSDFKGQRKTSDIIAAAGISRETFRKIERGQPTRLDTLRQISQAMKLSEDQWMELMIAWIKSQLGDQSSKLEIRPLSESSVLKNRARNPVDDVMMLFTNLNAAERIDIIKAMQRKEVRACLPGINRIWEKFSPDSSHSR
ncbi:MAG TPA: hypothetical protein VFW05_07675 [Verrucomicrobiae bacterium]|nr:hypothetical protein [Verrucomicrobiae bacterium]